MTENLCPGSNGLQKINQAGNVRRETETFDTEARESSGRHINFGPICEIKKIMCETLPLFCYCMCVCKSECEIVSALTRIIFSKSDLI